ncbi:MAG: DUF4445 domain-containing protein [Spirochaetes bacterium]|nr:MAG: DUF4445 domain-containing protein [Spirochaetota bacterium]
MPRILFMPANLSAEAAPGTPLIEAARAAGVSIDLPCGGKGTCGKCAVRVADGIIAHNDSFPSTESPDDPGTVRACASLVADGPAVIEVLATHEAALIAMDGAGAPEELPAPLDPDGPLAAIIRLSVPAPGADDGLSDMDRTLRALAAKGFANGLGFSTGALRALAGELRAEEGNLAVTLTREGFPRVIRAVRAGSSRGNYGLAVDLGTTTVAALLVDLESGIPLASRSAYNGQIRFGRDVIGRINFASRPGGLDELAMAARDSINGIIGALAEAKGIHPMEINAAVISGNTVMTHLLLGLVPEYIRLAPYTPTVLSVPPLAAHDAGIRINPGAALALSPCVGSYVGGDITAGLLASGVARQSEGVSLFLDIGTNGELVVGGREFLMTCACSAGPAFEGGGIDSGMRAAPGAIDRVTVDPESGEPAANVMGGGPARGICGSGMIALVAELFRAGMLDPSGKLVREPARGRVAVSDRKASYLLADEAPGGRTVSISENDIGNLVRAKAAIYAACTLVLSHLGLDFGDLARVYVAGGFGKFLDLEHAITVGLLPDLPRDRFTYLGNASLLGSYRALVSERERALQRELAARMTYIDPGADPAYMDHYTAALFLPHTDARRFPSVRIKK